MGNNTATTATSQPLLSDFQIIEVQPDTGDTLLLSTSTGKQYCLKEYTIHGDYDYEQFHSKISNKKQHAHPNVLSVVFSKSKTEKSLCSATHKYYVIVEFPFRTVFEEIRDRRNRARGSGKLGLGERFSEEEVWSILYSCCMGLQHLYQQGYRHQSLSSNHLYISKSGLIQISDPLVLRHADNPNSICSHSSQQHIYLSPQQLFSSRYPSNYSPLASDVFTLGVIMLEILHLEWMDDLYDGSGLDEQRLRAVLDGIDGEVYGQRLRQVVRGMVGLEVKERVGLGEIGRIVEEEGGVGKIEGSNEDTKEETEFSKDNNTKFTNSLQNSPVSQTKQPCKPAPLTERQQAPIRIPPNSHQHRMKRIPSSLQLTNSPHPQPPLVYYPQHLLNEKPTHTRGRSNSDKVKLTSTQQQSASIKFSIIREERERERAISQAQESCKQVGIQREQRVQSSINMPVLYKGQKVVEGSQTEAIDQSRNTHLSRNTVEEGSKLKEKKKKVRDARDQVLQPKPKNPFLIKKNEALEVEATHPQINNKTQVVVCKKQEQKSESIIKVSVNNTKRLRQDTIQSCYSQQAVEDTHSKITFGPDSRSVRIHGDEQNTLLTESQKNKVIPFKPVSILQNRPENTIPNNTQPATQTPINSSNQIQTPRCIHHPTSTAPSSSTPSSTQYVCQGYSHGGKYQGYKVGPHRQGFGKFSYPDGGYYQGQWNKNKMQGYGKLFYQNGDIAYQGYWRDDLFNGSGKLWNDSPEELTEPFDWRNMGKVGSHWVFYCGGFVDDNRAGIGMLRLTNGEVFQGRFKDDEVDGPGVFYSRDGQVHSGVWNRNKFI